MSYYYAQPGQGPPDKPSMYSGLPGSVPGSLSGLGYPGQPGVPGGGMPGGGQSFQQYAAQASMAGMGGPGSPPVSSYSASPYAAHPMYQSALGFQPQPGMGMSGPSASAFMAAAAEAQQQQQQQQQIAAAYASRGLTTTSSSPYGHTACIPGGSPRGPASLYGYPGGLSSRSPLDPGGLGSRSQLESQLGSRSPHDPNGGRPGLDGLSSRPGGLDPQSSLNGLPPSNGLQHHNGLSSAQMYQYASMGGAGGMPRGMQPGAMHPGLVYAQHPGASMPPGGPAGLAAPQPRPPTAGQYQSPFRPL